MTKKKKVEPNTLRWDWETQVSPEEFLNRITPMIQEPLRNMNEMEGDMYMSDYQKLMSVFWKLENRNAK
jgi:hypothetical protein